MNSPNSPQNSQEAQTYLPKIAILGRPNVGKSSLFNMLLKQKDAIISEIAGTTRSVNKKIFELETGFLVELLDTGGIELHNFEHNTRTFARIELLNEIRNHALRSALRADLVLFLVDGKNPPNQDDKKLFLELSKNAKNIFLVVNKVDNAALQNEAFAFYEFGTNDVIFISVAHKLGIDKLKQSIKKALKKIPENPKEARDIKNDIALAQNENEIKVSIIGRVNVGKSSLLNALCEDNLSIVSPVAGTTTDIKDERIEFGFDDKKYGLTFIDTAGIRQKGRLENIEKYALLRAENALSQSDIAILVLDSSADFVDLDEKISSLVQKHSLGVLIALNKWDIAKFSYEEIEKRVRSRFKFLSFAPIITISALNSLHIKRLKEKIISVYNNMHFRIKTSELNNLLDLATRRHPIPSVRGKIIKTYFMTQYAINPPSFSVVINHDDLHFSYKRYLINTLRENYDFTGASIVLKVRNKNKAKGWECNE
ncbi:MAG: ribosome biogenesis GTPase Der [Helicobacter sp.]|nr:ribosome biogenesis GTPase Der [Helicobacter sp.]